MAENEDDISEYLKEVESIQTAYVASRISWYQNKKKWPRRLARATTIALVVLSSGVPFLASSNGWKKDVLLPIAALLIAALSGLKASYQWEKTWQAYAVAQFMIEDALGTWKLKMSRARRSSSPKAGIDRAYRATLELLRVASTAREEETKVYFEDLRAAATSTRRLSGEAENRSEENS